MGSSFIHLIRTDRLEVILDKIVFNIVLDIPA